MLARGFRLARMDLTWTTVEAVCGHYNFSVYDTLLAQMEAHGVRPYWILDYANPCYPGTIWPACNTAACIAGYGRFAAAVAEHYKGKDIVFESVNEPNGMGLDNATDIVALCRAAYPAFVASGGRFVAPALSTFDPLYLTVAVQAGLLNYVMAVSVHPCCPGQRRKRPSLRSSPSSTNQRTERWTSTTASGATRTTSRTTP